jgi:hypothetical protein
MARSKPRGLGQVTIVEELGSFLKILGRILVKLPGQREGLREPPFLRPCRLRIRGHLLNLGD